MMGGGDVLKRCCYRSMKENKKRTSVTILGIILSTALITGVACMAVSLRQSMIAYEKQQNGDFHYLFTGVDSQYLKYFQNNVQIADYGLAQEVGYAYLAGSQNPDKPYIHVSAIEEGMGERLALHLSEGRMPENDGELAVGRHIRSNGLVDIGVGDVLTLDVGNRLFDGYRLTQESSYQGAEEELTDTAQKTYTVVGIIDRPNQEVEPRTAPGYSAFTCLEEACEGWFDVYASYTDRGLRQRDQVTAGILGVSDDLYYRYYNGQDYTDAERQQIRTVAKSVRENYWLLKWELMIFSTSTIKMLYGMCAVAVMVIIVTSVFCIRNSFVISLTEKMKLYGRLSSVGTTSVQQRRIVYYEAGFLGLTGIPAGVAGGVLATLILVKAVGRLAEDALGFTLVFEVSFLAIAMAAVLSMVTVYASAAGSARRAAKLSPISAIRANDTVKISRRELGCPALIGGIFGIGGRIAYKNLRRSRVKYRTTVISIVVSVAVFIGMSTFVEMMMHASDYYYGALPYQIHASIYQWKFYENALEITRLEGVQESEVVRSAMFSPDPSSLDLAEEYKREFEVWKTAPVVVMSLGPEGYERYCGKVGVSVEEARGKAIALADYEWETAENGKVRAGAGEITSFQPGEILEDTESGKGLEILLQTKARPDHMERGAPNRIVLIVSDEWMNEYPATRGKYDNVEVYLKCEDADKIETTIRNDMQLQHFTVTNYDAQVRSERSMNLLIAIFLYGFLAVVALIGITNIFNTITTNMELRAPEFATLKSVGMTGREFRRMIWLEGMFYGGKALLIGLPLGLVLSACFHRSFNVRFQKEFSVPWTGMTMAALAVAALLYLIMHYSMSKINRRNIIDTIRNENI